MSNDMHERRVWLFEEDCDRLERLMKRTGYSKSAVVRAALKLYEDGLNAVDEAMARPSSMSFEVLTED